MALSQKALQKKREKKKRLRQAKPTQILTAQPNHLTYSRWPLHECWVPIKLWNLGIGHVIVARKSSLGDIAVSLYLIDTYCLGIKDCFIRLLSPLEYKEILDRVTQSTGELQSVTPTYASTLIHKAKDYAMQFGFKPHTDFIKVQWMLKDIPIDNTLMFTFGKDNKPLYVQGPNESSSDVRRIIQTLKKNLGEDKYNYILELQ